MSEPAVPPPAAVPVTLRPRRWRRLWFRRTPAQALIALDARIRPDFKRAIAGAVLAIACLIAGDQIGGLRGGSSHQRLIVLALTLAFILIGAMAVRSTARECSRIARSRASGAAGSGLYMLVSVIGYLLILLGLLQLAEVRLASLLVGGAVTGVVLGIAAQQSLGNFFAGLVLLFARPFVAGDRVKVHTGALGGPFEGVIIESGLIYTTIETDSGVVNLPNSGLLSSAIGPASAVEPAEAVEPADALEPADTLAPAEDVDTPDDAAAVPPAVTPAVTPDPAPADPAVELAARATQITLGSALNTDSDRGSVASSVERSPEA